MVETFRIVHFLGDDFELQIDVEEDGAVFDLTNHHIKSHWARGKNQGQPDVIFEVGIGIAEPTSLGVIEFSRSSAGFAHLKPGKYFGEIVVESPTGQQLTYCKLEVVIEQRITK